jgi:hypothetical protein
MANETEYEKGQGGSDPSKPMSDPNDPAVKPRDPVETDPMRNPGAPDRERPEDWKDPNETKNPDKDDSSRSNN